MARLLGQSCGLSRGGAALPALDPASARVDDRELPELLAMGSGFAELVGYAGPDGTLGDGWSELFRHSVLFLLADIATFVPQRGQGQAATLNEWARTVDEWYNRALGIDEARSLDEQGVLARSLNKIIVGALAPLMSGAGPAALGGLGELWSSFPKGAQSDQTAKLGEELEGFERGFENLKRLARAYLVEEMSARSDHAPHAGLYAAFLKVQQALQQDLNKFTERHLDHYYDTVLALRPRAAEPDCTYVGLQLIPRADTLKLPVGTLLSAGKDAAGAPVEYATLDELEVSQAKLAEARTLHINRTELDKERGWVDAVCVRNVAVEPVLDPDREWKPLGEAQTPGGTGMVPAATYGMVLSSPVLRLEEGTRDVTVRLCADAAELCNLRELFRAALKARNIDRSQGAAVLAEGCIVELSGAKGWQAVEDASFALDDAPDSAGLGALVLRFTLAPDAPAWVANPKLSAGDRCEWPMLRLTLAPDARLYLYTFFASLSLRRVRFDVKASGLTRIEALSGAAPLLAGQPFAPFGVLPDCATELQLWHPELAGKRLTTLTVTWTWKRFLPEGRRIADYYAGYPMRFDDSLFLVDAALRANGQCFVQGTNGLPLFSKGYGETRFDFVALPRVPAVDNPTQAAPLVLSFTLRGPLYAFGHQDFARVYTDQALANAAQLMAGEPPLPTLANPLSPLVAGVTLDYTASAELELGTNQEDGEARCSYFGPFSAGVAHGVLQKALVDAGQHEGHLYLGFEDAAPDTTLTLYFALHEKQFSSANSTVASGSADALEWRYLAKDGWKQLPPNQISSRTDGFTRSDTVRLRLPHDIVTDNPAMPPDRAWIEARVKQVGRRVSPVRGVLMHAVRVQRQGMCASAAQAALLPPASIVATARRMPTVAAVLQPYPTTGGRAPEDPAAFRVRVSQRLRHKQRASQPGDYECLALDLFPQLGQAKCSCANNSAGFGQAAVGAGDVVVTVLRRERIAGQAPLPLPLHMLREIATNLHAHAARGVRRVVARNPAYDTICVYLAVRFAPEKDPAYSSKMLQRALNRAIAPWLDDPERALDVGCSSIEVDMLAEVARGEPYVLETGPAAVLHQPAHGKPRWVLSGDSVAPSRPWTVFMPAPAHFFNGRAGRRPTGIGAMTVGDSLVVAGKMAQAAPNGADGRRYVIAIGHTTAWGDPA